MNRHDSGRFCTESLESAAKRYKTLGFSIIPLNGARNLRQAKLPLIKWTRFQHSLPSDEELQIWFGDQPETGIGIVCGRISRLMVLDFDDATVASEFRHLHPDLAHTFTVRSGTRKLPHFYYRLPEGMLVQTSAYRGVDLRGEGSYVVAPPTCVGEAVWSAESDLPVREISDFDLRRLMRFLSSQKAAPIDRPLENVETVSMTQVSEFRRVLSVDELISFYHQRCCTGRNHALFQTALVARDAGISEADFSLALASVHAVQPGAEQEKYGSRYTEALRTIASAYSRPRRKMPTTPGNGLSNAVREWLLGHNFSNVARVLDGLYAVGMKPEQLFTELDACHKLAALKIGRRSIMAALKVVIGDYAVFAITSSPLHPPDAANAAMRSEDLNNSCKMSRGAKRVKNGRRGRPARLYQLPSPDEVADRIGVEVKSGDVLSDNDFSSSKAYRQALHHQLLIRRPGHYVRPWLGARLGVSRWTIRRYEKALGIQVRPTYSEQSLSWRTAATLPQQRTGTAYGVFIETTDGRRYPAIRGLALRLLKNGQAPVLKHQQANYYASGLVCVGIPTPQAKRRVQPITSQRPSTQVSTVTEPGLSVGIPTPPTNSRLRTGMQTEVNKATTQAGPNAFQNRSIKESTQTHLASGVGIPTPPKIEPSFWLCPECLNFHITEKQPTECSRCHFIGDWEMVSPMIWQEKEELKQWWQQRYREHQQVKRQRMLAPAPQPQDSLTGAARALIAKLHDQIPDLSHANARKLVHQFSGQLIERALSAVRERRGLRSPAGFIVAFLRSENKLLSNNKNVLVDTSNAKGETAIEWLRRLAQSEYRNFIANVDDILRLDLEFGVLAAQS